MSDCSLLVISDREPLWWLLSEQRFALPESWRHRAPQPGHRLLMYATRGCYRNPGRDRGLVLGTATVTASRTTGEVVQFRGRDFPVGMRLRITGVAPPHASVELGPLAGTLDALPHPATWSVRLRRALVPLSDHDEQLVRDKLDPLLQPRTCILSAYRTASKTA